MLSGKFELLAVDLIYRHSQSADRREIKGIPGATLFRSEDQFNVTMRHEERDFIVRRADLGALPIAGDEIHCNGQRFLVTAPGGEDVWRWHARYTHTQLRVHTKYLGEL